MRQREVPRSFGNAVTWEQTIYEHAVKAIDELSWFPFRATRSSGRVLGHNTLDLSQFSAKYDLVYLDPPYLNSRGVGVDYSDFYGFLEGLCDYNLFAEGDNTYPHKPIFRKPSRWNSPESALRELDEICHRWAKSIVFLSYRSDGRPTPAEAKEVLSQSGRRVELHSCGEYKYVLSRSRSSEELFLISFP
jgi:adenine-specific DNA-methyltransferase